jgi:NADH-quinone oxidoreductase subunit F
MKMKKFFTLNDLEAFRTSLLKNRPADKPRVLVCASTGCCAFGAQKVVEGFKAEVKKRKLGQEIEVKATGCHGFCERGPLVVVYPQGIFYSRTQPEDTPEIISRTVLKGEVIERLLYTDPVSGKKITYEKDVPFYKGQKRLVLANCGRLDPKEISDYIESGGYASLGKVICSMSGDELIGRLKRSGLRGRGGAGFSTGRKWEIVREQKAVPKYIICNADEGDPGAYMDRSILESNPHSVIEGMAIGAYAIGACEGWVYVRNEYPLAIKHLSRAIEQARGRGLLGKNILGSAFKFDIKIARGAGAFVCGEETALIASIEGGRGMPVQRPPFPAQRGLFGQPTNINNVETWANVPIIIEKGEDWFAAIGTSASKGSKIFSLVGNVQNTGLVEVPMGITLAEIVYGIGGGAPKGKAVKAVQIGGPSGGCVPEKLFHLPIDYESLTAAGTMMGSGGMVVMDERSCMVDMARYFLSFTVDESCGKCVPCRVGLKRMLEVLEEITAGRGRQEHISFLEEASATIKDTALCGLGSTAPNPVLTTIRYFLDEYRAHIQDKVCPARVCTALLKFTVSEEKCIKCGRCFQACPVGAIEWQKKEYAKINREKCIRCKACINVCPTMAIE